MLEMILNELSLQPANDRYIARRWMDTFVQTAKTATGQGVARSLRTQRGVFDIALAIEYSLAHWINDRTVDREARRYFQRLSTKTPYWDGLPELCDSIAASEFHFGDRAACGLGVAYLLENLAISLPSEECWDVHLVTLHAMSIVEAEEETEDDFQESDVQVVHASQESHIDGEWIRNRLRRDVLDGNDLWMRRKELFSGLSFCQAVEGQVRDLPPVMLSSTLRRLFELEAYCQSWTEGGFDKDQLLNATPESESTLGQYGSERTFTCPDGLERTFSWHVRLTPNAWRTYFAPVHETRTMIIGYIGPHLRTARYH